MIWLNYVISENKFFVLFVHLIVSLSVPYKYQVTEEQITAEYCILCIGQLFVIFTIGTRTQQYLYKEALYSMTESPFFYLQHRRTVPGSWYDRCSGTRPLQTGYTVPPYTWDTVDTVRYIDRNSSTRPLQTGYTDLPYT